MNRTDLASLDMFFPSFDVLLAKSKSAAECVWFIVIGRVDDVAVVWDLWHGGNRQVAI